MSQNLSIQFTVNTHIQKERGMWLSNCRRSIIIFHNTHAAIHGCVCHWIHMLYSRVNAPIALKCILIQTSPVNSMSSSLSLSLAFLTALFNVSRSFLEWLSSSSPCHILCSDCSYLHWKIDLLLMLPNSAALSSIFLFSFFDCSLALTSLLFLIISVLCRGWLGNGENKS